MSRSALWRQEGKARERQQAADDAWDEALAEGKVSAPAIHACLLYMNIDDRSTALVSEM